MVAHPQNTENQTQEVSENATNITTKYQNYRRDFSGIIRKVLSNLSFRNVAVSSL